MGACVAGAEKCALCVWKRGAAGKAGEGDGPCRSSGARNELAGAVADPAKHSSNE